MRSRGRTALAAVGFWNEPYRVVLALTYVMFSYLSQSVQYQYGLKIIYV